MKKTDNPVVIINGNNNNVDVKVIVAETPSTHPVAIKVTIAIFFVVIVVASLLAVSFCCPELLADFVRWIIGIAVGS